MTERRLNLLSALILVGLIGLALRLGLLSSQQQERLPASDRHVHFTDLGQFGGPVTTITGDGDHLYAAVGARIEVWDLQDPLAPQRIGSSRTIDAPQNILVELIELAYLDDHLIALDRVLGLLIFDVSDPSDPRQVAQLPLSHLARQLALHGRTAYVTGQQLFEIDLSNLRAPRLNRRVQLTGISTGLEVAGDQLYVSAVHSDGLLVYALPSLEETGRIVIPTGDVLDLLVDGDVLHVANRSQLISYDLSDWDQPAELGENPSGSRFWLQGERIYLSGKRRLNVYERDERGALTQIQEIEEARYDARIQGGQRIWGMDDAIYVAGGQRGVQIIDPGGPQLPAIVGRFPKVGSVTSLAFAESVAYASVPGDGIYSIDLSDPAEPRLIDRLIAIRDDARFAIEGERLYLTTFPQGEVGTEHSIYVYDISTPRDPQLLARFPEAVTWDALHLAVHSGVLHVATHSDGLYSFDLNDPDRLVPTSHIEIGKRAFELSKRGSELIVLNTGAGPDTHAQLRILSLEDPSRPSLIAQLELSLIFADILAVQGNLAAIGSEEGLELVDLSDPARPVIVEHGKAPFVENQVQPSFIAEGILAGYSDDARTHSELLAVDVADPSNPRLAGRLASPSLEHFYGFVSGRVYRDAYLFIPTHNAGLHILQFELRDGPPPSPARPATLEPSDVSARLPIPRLFNGGGR